MKQAEVIRLVTAIHTFDSVDASINDARAVLAQIGRVAGWLESRRLAAAGRLAELSTFPERHVAEATRTSDRDAAKTTRRAKTVASCDALGEALADGRISGEHVDAITRANTHMNDDARAQFADQIAGLVPVAERTTPAEFDKAVRAVVEQTNLINSEERLSRQKVASRVRTWTDKTTGMWHIRGEFDPETGLQLHSRIERMMATKFAERVPDGCPTDPVAKQDWLRAQALTSLILGDTMTSSGAPETVIVVDTRTSTIRWDLDIDLPTSAVQRFVNRSTRPLRRHSRQHHQLGRREPRPRSHHPARQSSATPRETIPACHLRRSWLQRALRPDGASPHHLVASRWPHQPRQPHPAVHPAPRPRSHRAHHHRDEPRR